MGLQWLAVGMLGLTAATAMSSRSGDVEQPVAFNHYAHIENADMTCTKCHTGAETNRHAGFPPDMFCAACHEGSDPESPAEAKLVELLEKGEPLAWKQVTHVEPYAYFSHRRHVGIGNIDCTACHGKIAELTTPVKEPEVDFTRRKGMQACMNCHRHSANPHAGLDCVDCHR